MVMNKKEFIIFICISLLSIILGGYLAFYLKHTYSNNNNTQYRYLYEKHMRDSIQANMKYRHDSIEFEFYKNKMETSK
jgi:hypothetical protein